MAMHRRELFTALKDAALYTLAISALERIIARPTLDAASEPSGLKPLQLGNSIDNDKARWYRLEPESANQKLLDLPMGRARVAVYADEVMPEPGKFDFRTTHKLIQKAADKGMLIDLVMGMKTFGKTEVNLPSWMFKKYPYLNDDGVTLDREEGVRQTIRDYLYAANDQVISRHPQIQTILVENEGLSKRLEVSRGRHVSQEFLLEEAAIVKEGDPYNRPVVQNANWDTPEAGLWLLTRPEFDIIAANVYNNTSVLFRPLLWKWVEAVSMACKVAGKEFAVSEYQAAFWLDGNGEPKFPFSSDEFITGYKRLTRLNPGFLIFWDVYQHYWEKMAARLEVANTFVSDPRQLGLRPV